MKTIINFGLAMICTAAAVACGHWKKKDEQMFIDYYTAIDYRTVNRLKKIKRKEKLTTHNLFFLLLLEMGKSEEYIATLFGINQRSIDTIKTRTKPAE